MTRFEAPSRTRRRGLAATAIAVVLALLAVGSPLAASADELPTTGTVSGTVTTPDGQPIEGATVMLFPSAATTDAAGHFELADVAFGEHDLNAYLAEYTQAPFQHVTLSEASPTATVNFVLVPFPVGDGTITGVVTVDGEPLAGASVYAYQPGGPTADSVTSDENGVYSLTGLTNGQWYVFVFDADDYQQPNRPFVTLTDAAPDATQDIPFLSWPTGTSRITGTVTDLQTGEPIAGAYLHLSGTAVPRQYSVATDASGVYSFDALPADSYSLSLWQPGYLSVSRTDTVANAQTDTVNLALVPTNATISGHVAGPDGAPVVGIYVSASNEGGSYAAGQTDANGDYVIAGVGAASYTVAVGGIGTPYKLKEKTVTPVANGNAVVNFSLKNRTTGYLTGMVWGPDGEYHLAPVCVSLISTKSKKVVAETITRGEHYGDGTYAFDNVKPGSYTVRFKDCDGDRTTKYNRLYLGGVKKFKDATVVTIGAGVDSYENDVTLTVRGN